MIDRKGMPGREWLSLLRYIGAATFMVGAVTFALAHLL